MMTEELNKLKKELSYDKEVAYSIDGEDLEILINNILENGVYDTFELQLEPNGLDLLLTVIDKLDVETKVRRLNEIIWINKISNIRDYDVFYIGYEKTLDKLKDIVRELSFEFMASEVVESRFVKSIKEYCKEDTDEKADNIKERSTKLEITKLMTIELEKVKQRLDYTDVWNLNDDKLEVLTHDILKNDYHTVNELQFKDNGFELLLNSFNALTREERIKRLKELHWLNEVSHKVNISLFSIGYTKTRDKIWEAITDGFQTINDMSEVLSSEEGKRFFIEAMQELEDSEDALQPVSETDKYRFKHWFTNKETKSEPENNNLKQEEMTKKEVCFGEAIKALKQGKRVARSGWNGKGLFIFMQVPAEVDIKIVPNMYSLPHTVKAEFAKRAEGKAKDYNQSIEYKNQLALVKPDNTIHGWSPSTEDTLSEDWVILD